MDKAALLHQICAALRAELEVLHASARDAAASATHEDAKPENQYDTRGLEASYLAGAQAGRATALEQRIAALEQLSPRRFRAEDAVALTALVELEGEDGARRRFFVAPEGGGLRLDSSAGDLQVVTPAAPLGQALIGKRLGDEVQLRQRGQLQTWELVRLDDAE